MWNDLAISKFQRCCMENKFHHTPYNWRYYVPTWESKLKPASKKSWWGIWVNLTDIAKRNNTFVVRISDDGLMGTYNNNTFGRAISVQKLWAILSKIYNVHSCVKDARCDLIGATNGIFIWTWLMFWLVMFENEPHLAKRVNLYFIQCQHKQKRIKRNRILHNSGEIL